MDATSPTQPSKPNSQLLALFTHGGSSHVPDNGVNATKALDPPGLAPAPLPPNVDKFLKYAEKPAAGRTAYPPYGLAFLMEPAPNMMQGRKRGKSGSYKDTTYARCVATVEKAFGASLATTVCYRCKGTIVVCSGARDCCFGSECFLAGKAEPCFACHRALVIGVSPQLTLLTSISAAHLCGLSVHTGGYDYPHDVWPL